MKSLLAAFAAVLFLCCPAQGEAFTRSVPAGQTSDVFMYRPWNNSCTSTYARAKLVAKPQHGFVSHRYVTSAIPAVDRLSGRRTRCVGQPVTGFVVTYTPARGFRGMDSFSLDMHFPSSTSRPLLVDTFTILVE